MTLHTSCHHDACHGRRHFIGSLGALAASALLPGAAGAAQAAVGPGSGRIDFHHHYFSPAWVRLVESKHRIKPVLGFDQFKIWTIAQDLEAMDRGNVEKAFLSVTQPGVWFGDAAETRTAARELNEFAARMKSDHRGRYGQFAVLPLPDVDATLREIEYAFDTLGADGVGLLSSYDDKWLGDKSFAPVWAELNRRKAVVYIHATAPGCCSWDFQPGILPTFIELGSDLARAMVSMVQGGTAKATPAIRYIWSHGGGSIWAQRFLVGESTASLAREAPADSRLYQFRRFFYDTAAAADAIHMGILKLVVPPTQIVFGSDFPWVEPVKIAAGLESSGLTPQDLQAVYRDNA
ncbi:twin-arginine translocation pathway signal protein [Cupriavidus basilensis OR16]|uniref:Twin-arginine translocation pathway signal protein n=1 Tax=Cupriavidus basilensis OR16 TaxID=1127483 RepID=H1RYJ8_9BURK|nr:amidohydrolase family protein [Cupriavidus basilensis]EHP44689.1 twin-arginine translocation pathway signal protein [Cupriavidus basilensis OR16]